jgi:hypothetical protein
MHMKAAPACCALVVLALALVPATAAASPRLETAPGVVVPVGTVIKGQNVGLNLWTASLYTVECPKAELTGKVTANSGTQLEITVESLVWSGTEFEGICTSPISQKFKPTATTPWCLKSTSLGSWTIRGGACGGAPTAVKLVKDMWERTENPFRMDFLGECKYERGELTGTYKTNSSPLEFIDKTGQSFTRTSGVLSVYCPELESIDFDYKLTLSSGEELKIT